jgi:histidine triad (HIT) family protein
VTIFERIARREISAKIVCEQDEFLAFHDANPQAPVHVLIVPKKCVARIGEASDDDALLLGKMLLASKEIARELGVFDTGYRLVVNHGPDAGESVPHLHIHLLAGRTLGWPPG